MSKKRILFASSEVYPFAKSGGLADVAHSLPRSLSEEYKVSVVMPLYQFIDREEFGIVEIDKYFDFILNGVHYFIELYGCKYEGINYYFIYTPLLCDKEFLYGLPHKGYHDNAIRFGLFNYAIVALLKYKKYDIVHLNDWQSALVPLLLQDEKTIHTKSLFTIHNLSYQGIFEKTALEELGINEKYFTMDGVEFHDKMSFMKAGIAYSDMITTVSPTYAKEILSSEFGCGLDGFLNHHSNKLVGIINGIDTEHFSPSTDKTLVQAYTNLTAKAINKKSYLKKLGLVGIKKPLFVFIGRFTWQKGIDLLIDTLEELANFDCNIAILGEGEEKYHNDLKKIAEQHKNIHLTFTYDEALSHQMYAASDFLLMPSLFEPCGLNQLIAMNYGSIPIVHSVGGLIDTVTCQKNFNAKKEGDSYGIIFTQSTSYAFLKAVNQALELYANKRQYNKIVKHNMQSDYSWQKSSLLYSELYRQISE